MMLISSLAGTKADEANPFTTTAGQSAKSPYVALDSGGGAMSLSQREEQWHSCRKWSLLIAIVMVISLLFVFIFRTAVRPESTTAPNRFEKDGKVRIAVVVMPSPPSAKVTMTRIERILAIRDTWAQDLLSGGPDLGAGGKSNANRVVFVLDEGDPAIGVALEDMNWKLLVKQHQKGNRISTESDSRVTVVPKTVSQSGKDGYSRLRHVLAKVSRVYDSDFIFLCNDYTFVIAENLRCLVQNFDPSQPIYVGNQFRGKDRRPWINLTGNNMTSREVDEAMLNSGGAGILLSRGSLSLLGKAWGLIEFSTPFGQVHEGKREQVHIFPGNIEAIRLACMATSAYEKANPGVVLTRCLKHFRVNAQDCLDRTGGQRFNLYGPVLMAQGFVDPWYRRVYGSDDEVWRNGLQCCSSETVTFHYVTPAETYAIHHMMHNKEKFLDDGCERAFRMWPSSLSEELGAFAAVPRRGDQTFNLLLKRIEICRNA